MLNGKISHAAIWRVTKPSEGKKEGFAKLESASAMPKKKGPLFDNLYQEI